MSRRAVAVYSAGILVVLGVLGLVHRYVGRLAPAPPVDVSNVPLPIAPIPLPVETAPTILHSQPGDGQLPADISDSLARRPEPVQAPPLPSTSPPPLSDIPPADDLLAPIPEGKP